MAEGPDERDGARASFWRKGLPLERESTWFILASALDVFMTYILLSEGNFVESNPVARYFIVRWGVKGMVYFKFTMVALVIVIAQLIARRRIDIATWLLKFATALVACVVIYGIFLLLSHHEVPANP